MYLYEFLVKRKGKKNLGSPFENNLVIIGAEIKKVCRGPYAANAEQPNQDKGLSAGQNDR